MYGTSSSIPGNQIVTIQNEKSQPPTEIMTTTTSVEGPSPNVVGSKYGGGASLAYNRSKERYDRYRSRTQFNSSSTTPVIKPQPVREVSPGLNRVPTAPID